MRHTSVALDTPCEFINITPLNPLISKCEIKVCYVSDRPNRNGSIITKEVATKIANSIPGSPIVGFFVENENDFDEHSRELIITDDGKFQFKDITRPYGFVDLNAKCWFKKYYDDNQVEREYLVTEGYLWTGQYPEAQRIIDQGNNQSMEFDKKTLNGTWADFNNGKSRFFIINEAIISKLCILGEDQEPCFEGANIVKAEFSFDKEFYAKLEEMQTLLKEEKGGAQMFTKYTVTVGDSLWNALYNYSSNEYNIIGVFEDDNQKYAVLQSKNDETFSRLDFSFSEEEFKANDELTAIEFNLEDYEAQFSADDVNNFEASFKKNEDDKDEKDEESEEKEDAEDTKDSETKEDKKEENSEDKDDEEDKKKNKYSLEDIVEYVELSSKYSELETNYNFLVEEKNNLETELQSLRAYKASVEKNKKEDMINNQFYMLSAEDKKEVIDNIDNYSLEQIEEKLSVICFRNKVSFAENEEHEQPTTYNLGGNINLEDGTTPAWVKAVLETAKTLN